MLQTLQVSSVIMYYSMSYELFQIGPLKDHCTNPTNDIFQWCGTDGDGPDESQVVKVSSFGENASMNYVFLVRVRTHDLE